MSRPTLALVGGSQEPAVADAVVYVSSNVGNDTADGRSEGSAKATIAAAIAAIPAGVPGRVRFLPGSTHTISAQVNLRSDLTLDFNGALIQRAGGYAGDLFGAAAAVSKVTIQDGRFDNGGSTSQGFDLPNGCSEITFRRNRVTGHTSTFFLINNGSQLNQNIRVVSNSFYGDVTVEDQVTVNVGEPSNYRCLNNYFEGTGGCKSEAGSSVTAPCRHVHYRGNVFRTIIAQCILARVNGSSVMEDVVVSGNTAEEIGNAVRLKGLAVVGEQVGSPGTVGQTRRVTIFGNSIRGYWGPALGCGGGPVEPVMEDVSIVGNRIDAAPAGGVVDTTRTTIGIKLDGVTNCAVSSNVVRNTGRGGIRVTDPASNITIVGNVIDGCVANPNLTSPATSSEAGIVLFTGSNVQIIGNVVRNSGTAVGDVAGIGTDANSFITGVTIMGNRCYDNRTPQYQDYGIRIGVTGSTDANQPSEFIITNNDLRGNLTAGMRRYETSDHNLLAFNNKGTSMGAGGSVNADTPTKRILTATATLDFPSIAAGSNQGLTITVNGAATMDTVFANPDTSLESGLTWAAFVSAANTVTVRVSNTTGAAIDPASRNWRATVLRF